MLSVIIPAKNEIYLQKTIENVLSNAQDEIEVIAELDGYIPEPQIVMNDKRVTFIHHKESIGQRACINHGVSIAKGKYIMKLDAHCAVGPGFDVILAKDCQPDWTVIPRMYNLDITTWTPKFHKITDYMYFTSPDHPDKPFRAMYYEGHDYKKWHSRTELIDDVLCNMGPGWFMEKERFLAQGGCDEGHGGWGQMGIEVSLKAWLSGGSLKVNKNTWFAHWFRGGGGPGFPYQLSGSQVDVARKYSQDLWMNDKWPLAKRKLSWLIDKFQPPTWEKRSEVTPDQVKEINYLTYQHIHKGNRYPRWRGHTVLKSPEDLILYQQVIHRNKPDFIVETGTKWGGSASFFADICELNGHGQVISIDIAPRLQPEHKRITYLKGNSIEPSVLEKVKELVGNGSVMVVLDSKHTRNHVKWELFRYSKLVTQNQYIVLEDCYAGNMEPTGVMEARDWFLKRTKCFELVDLTRQFLIGLTRDGWIRKK